MPVLSLVRRAVAAVLAAAALATPAVAAVGFQVFKIPDPAGGEIEVGVWYPTDAQPRPMRFGLSAQTVAAGAPVTGQRLPLVVMSHGNGGFFGSHFDTAAALAEAGLVAAALTHTGDSYQDQSRATHMMNRPRQLSVLLTHMLRDWTARGQLDPERVGAFGFSSGGFTVLAAAGAISDRAAVIEHCRAPNTFFDCRLVAQHPPPAGWPAPQPDPRIKAIVSAAPAMGFSLTAESLAAIRQPVQLWQASDDEILPRPHYVEPVRARLPRPPEFHMVEGARHFDFLPPCAPDLVAQAPQICTPTPGFDRAAFHRDFNRDVVRFFSDKLGGPR